MSNLDTFSYKKSFFINDSEYFYYSLEKLFTNFNNNLETFPYSLKIIFENLLRNKTRKEIFFDLVETFFDSKSNPNKISEISYYPTRVLMQDFTGVPAIADLVAMRNALKEKKINPNLINPLIPVDLIIDHSVMVDSFGNQDSYKSNVKMEFSRNKERYEFLKWGQKSFTNFSVVPPGIGICHQVNLEHLAKTIWVSKIDNKNYIFPDSLVGTDSHTTMVNALSVLGWGVGGIEAEAAMLGQPITMNMPEVLGVNFKGNLEEGITATDLVLTVTKTLREKGVVGKFVEYFGDGLANITLADRATIANMSPEYGATCGFFPIDQETIKYLKLTGKSDHHIELVKKYAHLQGLWRHDKIYPKYKDSIIIDLNSIEPCMAGPKRPQDKISLSQVPHTFKNLINDKANNNNSYNKIQNGSVVIAAITSCTNTSNPNVLIAAGLVAKKAREKNLKPKSWVKTSFAPGSQVVTEYLKNSGLLNDLNSLGFNIVGYGCTTCIGNSGPLKIEVSNEIKSKNLTTCSVLSGNRNFEGRIHQEVKANYLASPPLVVIYALAGNVNIDITRDPIGIDNNNKEVYLSDLWPSDFEIEKIVQKNLTKDIFIQKYKDVHKGDENWEKIKINNQSIYKWDETSTYVKHPPFFSKEIYNKGTDIIDARTIAMLGDTVTTDHISPAGAISIDSPAGKYLSDRQVNQLHFNSYGSRRGNHEIMIRGTFANIRLKNELLPNSEGGFTKCFVNGEKLSIYQAAMKYIEKKIPLIVIAGKEYGTGSSRDWAAKGTKLLGIRAVIAESFERIHRSNLIGMGVIPFEFTENQNRKNLNLSGEEFFTIINLNKLKPKKIVKCKIDNNRKLKNINLLCRIDTKKELEYFRAGGILQFVLNNIVKNSA